MKDEKQGQYCKTLVEMTMTPELALSEVIKNGGMLPQQMAALREHHQHLLEAANSVKGLISTLQGVIDLIDKL